MRIVSILVIRLIKTISLSRYRGNGAKTPPTGGFRSDHNGRLHWKNHAVCAQITVFAARIDRSIKKEEPQQTNYAGGARPCARNGAVLLNKDVKMHVTGPYRQLASMLALTLLALTGCSPFKDAVPSKCVRPNFFDAPRANKEPINFVRLRQDPPPVYLLGPRDTLGLYIEGVLGRADEAPPVHFPQEPNTPPAIGYPMPVREDGTLSLPLIPPINVNGLTIAQAEHEIREAYTVTYRILRPDRARIIVTMMKPRTYAVMLVREDTPAWGMGAMTGTSRQGIGYEPERHGSARRLELKAYENDVLHALCESGSMPGNDAKNEITVLRGAAGNVPLQTEYQQAMRDPSTRSQLIAAGRAIKIPLRLGPGDPPLNITPDDVILNTGDILFVESRNAEVFYTGGLLNGKQLPLPRDYDVDVLAAIAMAGGSIAASAGGSAAAMRGGAGQGSIGSLFPATRVVVVRMVDGQMRSIKLNLQKAITDPKERILVLPNDLIILEYTEFELAMNVILNSLVLNLNVNQLFD